MIDNLLPSFPREQAPTSSRLNAVDLYLVVCVFFVFGKSVSVCSPSLCVMRSHLYANITCCAAALIEYAVILLLLKKRRKPRRTIAEGLQTVLSNGDVRQSGHKHVSYYLY